ncbi:hypothetical protein ACMAZE_03585 [Pseudopelagicola sp. nBUS_20]|uniref:hypothetical protein n=1 Tax=Pseudopelagicola sp. nBUS_20 TaxID=3395317 RepID=UPI003EB6DB36
MLINFIPIFVDIASFRLVLFGDFEPKSAVHIGYLTIGLLMVFKALASLLRRRFDGSSGIRIILFMIFAPFALLFSDAGLMIVIQFLSIIVFFPYGMVSVLSNITFLFRFSIICNSIFLAFFIIFNLLLPDILSPISIYQGLVTFPAAMMLYLYSLLCFLPVVRYERSRFWFFLLILNIVMIATVILDAGRKVSFLDLLVLTGLVHFMFGHLYLKRVDAVWFVKRRPAVVVALIYTPVIFFAVKIIVNSNIFARFVNDKAEGRVDGSRLSNWSDGMSVTFSSIKNLFLGADISQMNDINFHNFFFDTSVRFGFPITMVILLSFIFAMRAVWKRVADDHFSKVMFIAILSNVFLHSMINSALSQSLYISSLVFTLSVLVHCKTKMSEYNK